MPPLVGIGDTLSTAAAPMIARLNLIFAGGPRP